MNPITLIGIDIGYGYTKAYAGPPTPPVIFPSVIGIAENIKYTGDIVHGGQLNGIHLETEAGPRFVGDLALSQSRVNWSARDRRRSAEDTLTLALAGLSELDVSGPIKLITGLPVEWYARDRSDLAERLTGIHSIRRAGRQPVQVEVVETMVTVQPFGSLFYNIFNKDGKVINSDLARGQVGVIDIGMLTTDFIIADRGQYREPGSGSTTRAMARLYELLSDAIANQFDRPMTIHQTDQAVRQGYVKVRGRKHPLGDLVEPILSGLAADILAAVSTRWQEHEADLDTIIVCGGGANTIGPYLVDRFPNLMMMSDSNLTNVIGYHRYGLFRNKRAAPKRSSNGRVRVPA